MMRSWRQLKSLGTRNVLRLTRPTIPESEIKLAVLKALRWHPHVSWAEKINSGAYKPSGSDRWVVYGFKGCSDIIGQLKKAYGGVFLAIECKRMG
ncbi:MAG: hypothetical protein ACREBC_25370, partial [Pyrinomonadaceae bacterium]